MKNFRLIISGEGGQGIQTIAKVISNACFNSGLFCSFLPSFGVEQRGTPSVAFLSISDQKLLQPTFDVADIVMVLSERAIKPVIRYVNPNTTIIFDSSTISKESLPKNTFKYKAAPMAEYASEKFTPKAINIIATAILTRMINLNDKNVWAQVTQTLGNKFKDTEILEINRKAFEFGLYLVLETDKFSKPVFQTKHKTLYFKGHGKSAEIVPERCKGCGVCILKCPVAALKSSQDLGFYSLPVPHVDLEKCIACGNCKNFCPDGAIAVEKDKVLSDFIKKDSK